MMLRSLLCALVVFLLVFAVQSRGAAAKTNSSQDPPAFDVEHAPAPLFRDPIYDGAADPSVIWNPAEKEWLTFYTQRRATVPTQKHAWVFGTDIGIASSGDQGRTWIYRGIARGLNVTKDRDTFWAPDVLCASDGKYHMFVAYIRGVAHDWGGPAHIAHFTGDNLFDWKFESVIDVGSEHVIDPGLIQLQNGKWLMFFKDDEVPGGTRSGVSESDDLFHWKRVAGLAIGDKPHEAPDPFRWKDHYWLLTDDWGAIGVYRSDDGYHWERSQSILDTPGTREDDRDPSGHHPWAMVVGDRAYVFYFTHPGKEKDAPDGDTYHSRNRSSLQVAELGFKDGHLTCDRNQYAH